MKLHILFGQSPQDYDGECAPEALLVWDEYCIDENLGGFEKACEAYLKEHDRFVNTRVIVVSVDGGRIDELLNKAPEIEGTIS